MANIFRWLMTLAASSGVPVALLNDNQAWGKIITWGGSTLNNSDAKRAAVVGFYLNWHSVLHTNMMAMQKIVGTVNGWITLGLYHTVQALESVYNAVLKLFGIFSDFNSGQMGTLYKAIIIIAFSMLGIGLSYLLVENIFRAKTKLHDIITNLVVIIAILIMLPFGTNWLSQFTIAGSGEILGNGNSKVSSIAVQPIQNNIVDTIALVNKGFKVDPSKLDGQMSKYNAITDDTIDYLDLSEVVASDNLKMNNAPKGVDNVFKHSAKMGSESGYYSVIDATLPKKQSQLTKAFDSVYPRYTGHFVIADLQLIFIAIMFAFIAFRVGKSWFEILLLNLSAPLMGMQDLRTNQRLKEVMQAIQGSFISVMVEVISLRLFLIVMDYLGSAKNPGIEFLGQYPNSAVPKGIFLIIMYSASFMAFMSGVSLIERWTGVPQGKGSGMFGSLATAGMMATMFGGHGKGSSGDGKPASDEKVQQERDDDSGHNNSTSADPTKSSTTSQGGGSTMNTERADGTGASNVTPNPANGIADDESTKRDSDAPDDSSNPTEPSVGGVADDTDRADNSSDDKADPTVADGVDGNGSDGSNGANGVTRDDSDPTSTPDPTAADGVDGNGSDGSNGATGVTRDDNDSTSAPDPTAVDETNDVARNDSDTSDVPDQANIDGTEGSDEVTRSDGVETADTPDPSDTSSNDGPDGVNRNDETAEPASSIDAESNNGATGLESGTSYRVTVKPNDDGQELVGDTEAHRDLGSVTKNDNQPGPTSKLVKTGMVMRAIGQQGQQGGKTMVNVPEIKVDDSIY
ncbi:pLS20_p028 family conjugation system transmembrane protein [Lactiplantibacillus plantarum]|uniref:pLS20_p028 family conjugation system transmembrane protein n=1 Tax=Lactiplantibacillus plantarum TaxID=1590 RepID=UPI000977870F|nr:hypothetical protein [Lactiplantibacillus plantarum]